MSLKELLERHIAHRDEAIARRTNDVGKALRMEILREELRRIAKTFGDRRRTQITHSQA